MCSFKLRCGPDPRRHPSAFEKHHHPRPAENCPFARRHREGRWTIRQVATCPSRSRSVVRVGQRWVRSPCLVGVGSRLTLSQPFFQDLHLVTCQCPRMHLLGTRSGLSRRWTQPWVRSHLELKPFPTPLEKHICRDISNLP